MPANPRSFRIVILGDSVLWGQGLQEYEKIHTYVIRMLKERNPNLNFNVTVMAHSGAIIGIDSNGIEDTTSPPTLTVEPIGEVPTDHPTILQQCDSFANAPAEVDLVVLNGGINDVNIRTIFNPFVETPELSALIEQHCYQNMKKLLGRVTGKFTRAQVVVTGYYPIVSEESNLTLLEVLLIGIGALVGNLIGGIVVGTLTSNLKGRMIENCRTFDKQSQHQLLAAVNATNNSLRGTPRVSFASPGFVDHNSALAPEPWLFGINPDLSPQDSISAERATACTSAATIRNDVNVLQCEHASVGHPNPRGAREYAYAIVAALSEPVKKLDYRFKPGSARDFIKDGTWFRDAQDRYAMFRGVNFGSRSKLPPYLPVLPLDVTDLSPASVDRFHQELKAVKRDLDRLKRLGFNIVRLPVMWKAIEPRPNPDLERLLPEGEQYLSLVKEVIDALYKRGLFVIVDFHQDIAHEVYGGDGFPDWALAIDADHERPSPPSDLEDELWGLHYYDTPLTAWDVLVRHTLHSFWRNKLSNIELSDRELIINRAQEVRTHLEKTIGATARFFQALYGSRGHPAILGYEPFNEPHPVGIPKPEFEGQILPQFYRNALREIRRASASGAAGDSRAFLFVEPRMDWTAYAADGREFDNANFSLSPETYLDVSSLSGERVVFSFHYYDPFTIFYFQFQIPGIGIHIPLPDNMHKKRREWPDVFRRLKEASTSRGLIPFLTEFGSSQDWHFDTDLRPEIYWRSQIRAYMDLQFQQVEAELLNATYWNYDLYNTKETKDNWNLENFSLLGPIVKRGRVLRHPDIVARPYSMRSSAEPSLLYFDLGTRHCAIILKGPVVDAPTVVFIPQELNFPNFEVRSTSPDLQWDMEQQLLYWLPDKNLPANQLVICPVQGLKTAILPQTVKNLLSKTRYKLTVPGVEQFMGNRRSREVHSIDCSRLRRIPIHNRNRVYFSTIGQALARGYNGCWYCLREFDTY